MLWRILIECSVVLWLILNVQILLAKNKLFQQYRMVPYPSVAEQVKELVYVRDRLDRWLLEREEINGIIIFVLSNIYEIICIYVFLFF